ncbi:hypothetical protein H3U94_09710 [Bartonella sp. W8125]|uniref:hypothetical protein n=1 Tax=Bartonella TaxID=773 RepID=UPI0018DB592F|nr:hypothetical protein [Bartonella choladocola]MBI0141145.1 hypothetical protein [Bartonella choladocola]
MTRLCCPPLIWQHSDVNLVRASGRSGLLVVQGVWAFRGCGRSGVLVVQGVWLRNEGGHRLP